MARIIAFYLPQYHPIPENDEWWGKGFTEWVNVAKAKPLFRGHNQPHIPADLGFYDLRMPEIREEQARMAREAGIEGFCYWHYWFEDGKELLERPFNEVLKSKRPDFPFCIGWANESWTNKTWHKQSSLVKTGILLEQKYSKEDYIKHFYSLLPAFKDERYILVDGKPLFYVFKPLQIPNPKEFIDLWNSLAIENGLKGFHFVGMTFNTSFREIGKQGAGKVIVPPTDKSAEYYNHLLESGFDAVNSRGHARAEFMLSGRYTTFVKKGISYILGVNFLNKFDHRKINEIYYVKEDNWEKVYPTIMPNWDRSPRSGKRACIYTHSTPEVFKQHVLDALAVVKNKAPEHQIIFLKSWNEWGEGNFMEPDLEYGHGYLDALKSALEEFK